MKKGYYWKPTNGCMKPQTIFITVTPRRCGPEPVASGTRLQIWLHTKKLHSTHLKWKEI